MNKLWKIVAYEYRRHVLRRRFLFALLSVPLWIAVTTGISLLAVILTMDNTPAGYVDASGLLAQLPAPEAEEGPFADVVFVPYANADAARAALDAGEIQAYYLIPRDYPANREVSLYFLEQPDGAVTNQLRDMLRSALLAGKPAAVAERVSDGPQFNVIATQEDRPSANADWFKIAMPIAAGIFLIVSVFTSSGYLMQAVVEEKENRTMEILATSVSPEQIMGGKTLALIAVGLTQVLVWSLFPLFAILLAGPYLPFLQGVQIEWGTIALVFALVIPTFVLISALMATVGATVTEAREGQQVSTLVTMPVMAPYMLAGVILTNPNSPVSLSLAFFPLTAALTMLLRMAFGSVPTWQILVSAAILTISAAGSLWLSGRVFRLGMLRYGQRLGWKDVLRATRKMA